jgi:hypothetical protein
MGQRRCQRREDERYVYAEAGQLLWDKRGVGKSVGLVGGCPGMLGR